jgi:hypothetical protein
MKELFIAFGIICFIGVQVYLSFNDEVVTATVQDKNIKRTHENSIYLIYTNVGTFKNTDSLLRGKFTSSDLYGGIKVGCTYKFTTTGMRLGCSSSYRNIMSYTKVSCPSDKKKKDTKKNKTK